jgi:hypothetical protein
MPDPAIERPPIGRNQAPPGTSVHLAARRFRRRYDPAAGRSCRHSSSRPRSVSRRPTSAGASPVRGDGHHAALSSQPKYALIDLWTARSHPVRTEISRKITASHLAACLRCCVVTTPCEKASTAQETDILNKFFLFIFSKSGNAPSKNILNVRPHQ